MKLANSSCSAGLFVEELENCSPPNPLGSCEAPSIHPLGYSTMKPLDAHSAAHSVKFGSTAGVGLSVGDGVAVGDGVEAAVGLKVGLGAGTVVVAMLVGLAAVLLCPFDALV